MREIKFRLFNEDTEEMFYLGDVEQYDNGVMFPTENNEHIDTSRCQLMQYTGLKDENRKEIYENDIVECMFYQDFDNEFICIEDEQIIKGTIKFDYGNWVIEIDDSPIHLYSVFDDYARLKVIGNIHQNKDLLNE